MATEADRWRQEAMDNLAKANKYLAALLAASASLVALTEIHRADDFGHCVTCNEPWPCRTAEAVHTMADLFKEPQHE